MSEFKLPRKECDRDALLQLADQLEEFAKDALKCKKRIHPIIVMTAVKGIREDCGVKNA